MNKEPAIRQVRSRPPQRRKSAADALSGIWAVSLTSFVLAAAYVGREVIVPLALAALIAFLLTPMVRRVERYLGRIVAVILTMLMIVGGTVAAGWTLTRQAVDLANQLPGYKENLRAKLQSIRIPSGGGFSRISATLDDLKKDLPAGLGAKKPDEEKTAATAKEPMPVEVVSGPEDGAVGLMKSFAAPVLGPLGTAALVLLLVTFMLLKSEDLQSRFIRLAGQGRISSTTRALDDAGTRIRKYLLMQLVVNVTYGIVLAIGLYFIGVPNAVLWGAIAAVLRFIPYIGPWIAAAFPMVLSLAVAPSWMAPALTVGLFIGIELLSNNVMEPWLYGSSTGVSSMALIVAAVFWTWMWGPVGLVLATPLTVCLVVMGRHIPQLSFLSVLLSEEDALTPAEDVYHRLLRKGEHDESDVVEGYLKNNTVAALYDQVLIPVMIASEEDFASGMVDTEQRDEVLKAMKGIVEELDVRDDLMAEEGDREHVCRIFCLPARAERDVLVGGMLANALLRDGFDVRHATDKAMVKGMLPEIAEQAADVVFISTVTPSTATHAGKLCQRIRGVAPDQKIVVGLWGMEGDLKEVTEGLKKDGADEVLGTIVEAVAFCEGYALQWEDDGPSAPEPADEEERQRTLDRLGLNDGARSPMLENFTAKLARVFEVPVSLVSLVDRDRQFFKASKGLPEDLAAKGETARNESVCAHVIAANELMVVEDLWRDRRFAGNPLIREHGLRFYAGVPLRASNGQPIGTLCLMDTRPRKFTRRERRLLAESVAELSREIGNLEDR